MAEKMAPPCVAHCTAFLHLFEGARETNPEAEKQGFAKTADDDFRLEHVLGGRLQTGKSVHSR